MNENNDSFQYRKAEVLCNWDIGPARLKKGDIVDIRGVKPCDNCNVCPGRIAVGAYIYSCYSSVGTGFVLKFIDKFEKRKERMLSQ